MSLLLHDAIVDTLRARFKVILPKVRVEAHEGDVSAETFKRWQLSAPGVYVICLGSEVSDLGRLPHPEWRFAAYVVASCTPCEGETEGERRRVAQALATRLIAIIHNESWGVGAQAPERIKADNRSTPQLAKQIGANLWVVTWQQQITLTAAEMIASERYVREPRPLVGVDTRINLDAPPAVGEQPLVTDSVDFPL